MDMSEAPFRVVVSEADGSEGSFTLTTPEALILMNTALTWRAAQESADSAELATVEFGSIEYNSDATYDIGGQRLTGAQAAELVAEGVVVALRAALDDRREHVEE